MRRGAPCDALKRAAGSLEEATVNSPGREAWLRDTLDTVGVVDLDLDVDVDYPVRHELSQA